MQTRRTRSWIAALALCAGLAAHAQTAPQTLPAVRLSAGIHNIVAELAQSPGERAIGLMHRREMGANVGMLFAFEAAGVQCFWMRNTPLPLSVAFLDDDGSVVNLADMKPHTETSHCSEKPVRFALEMNQGWFAKRGIKPGGVISGAPFGRPSR